MSSSVYLFSKRSRLAAAALQREWGLRGMLLYSGPFPESMFLLMLRIFFRYKHRLLGDLCQAAVDAILKYLRAKTGTELRAGIIASIQTFGRKINFHSHLHLLVTEGGEDSEGRIYHLAEFHHSLMAEFFTREVFSLSNAWYSSFKSIYPFSILFFSFGSLLRWINISGKKALKF